MSKAAVYLRVSSVDQNCDMQLASIRKYCEYHNIQFDVFQDKASGKSSDRVEFRRMLKMIRRKEYSCLIVYKLDRFSRSVVDTLQILSDLNRVGCGFVSVTESLDLSTPVGRLMMQMLSIFAQFERENIVARVKDGVKAAKARGVKFGRSRRVLPVTDKELLEMRKAGLTYSVIAKRLKVPKTTVIDRVNMMGACVRGGYGHGRRQ